MSTTAHESLLDLVLKPGALSPRYQPIFDIRGERPLFAGVECLIRGPAGSNLEAPDLLFSYARKRRAEADVDRAAITAELIHLPDAGSFPIHLNLNASTLSRGKDLGESLAAECLTAGIATDLVTIEVVEQSDPLDRTAFQEAVADLRQHGFTIALDDVGLGASNFLMFYLSRPEILKADQFFVLGLSDDPVRRAVLVAVKQLAAELGSHVVAEGVERESDLEALRALGIEAAQGYLLCRPLAPPALRRFIADGAPPSWSEG